MPVRLPVTTEVPFEYGGEPPLLGAPSYEAALASQHTLMNVNRSCLHTHRPEIHTCTKITIDF